MLILIDAADFLKILKKLGYSFYTGVPCSIFKNLLAEIEQDNSIAYISAANEGAALAIAAGAHLSGKKTCVLVQNQGLGNMTEPLTSLSLTYDIPCLILMSGRGYKIEDEPQHMVMGKVMLPILNAMEIPHAEVPKTLEELEAVLTSLDKLANEKRKPVVLVINKGDVTGSKTSSVQSKYPMSRKQVIEILSNHQSIKDMLIVSTTGKISRQLFLQSDSPNNFYMQGSMGHAISIALGLALNKPDKKIIVFDGDGAVLMHMGSLSTIGHYKPKNLIHVVLDNEAHGSTGNQATTSSTTDFATIAKGCGYSNYYAAKDEKQLIHCLEDCSSKNGPSLLHVKINLDDEKLPRITTKYSTRETADIFKNTVVKS